MRSVRSAPRIRSAARRAPAIVALGACVVLPAACTTQWYIDDADREVAALIRQRQEQAVGLVSNAEIDKETGETAVGAQAYAFVPSPVEAAIPPEFRRATTPRRKQKPPAPGMAPATEPAAPETAPDAATTSRTDDVVAQSVDLPEATIPADLQPFTLADTLAYAMKHARDYQFEKENLYLSALDLTLERFLWTPRFVNSALSLEYANEGEATGFDQTLSAISDFAVEQRLPYGGEITARVINSLVRDMRDNVTTGETGQTLIDVRLPLLRGAGRPAYESRYQAERELVYSVRDFERFRREFLVSVASDFFNLLSLKTQIDSAQSQAASLENDYRRAQAFADAGQVLQIEADRARVSLLNAENGVINAVERYFTALDAFKIRIGMPTPEPITVTETAQALDLYDPQVPERMAIETALQYRLDLVTSRDLIDDARRAVMVARNNLLPQVDLSGGVSFNTTPEDFNSFRYESENTAWRARLEVEVPLNRKQERNDLRSALIFQRRSERNYDQQADTVRLEVRRAIRRIQQARFSMQIQAEQIRINEFRADLARAKLDAGELESNRDVVEAEDELRSARNAFADAQSEFRRAVLEFLRDTGTLRVDDQGRWIRFGEAVSQQQRGETVPEPSG